MKTLVTGGAGFIGSHLVDQLLSAGHEVRVFDNLSTGKRANLHHVAAQVELVEGDVRDGAALEAAARDCEVAFHLAAIVSVQRSVESPTETQSVNVGGTLNLLNAARSCGLRRVVIASSAAVYGSAGDGAKREDSPTLPESPYGLEKLASEHYLRIWHELYGLETISLRYFNVFGPRQDPSSPYSGVISIFADRLLRGAAPMIFGDGEQTRDFVYVANVVEANMRAGFSDVKHGVFNVGCGSSTSLNELWRAMCKNVGADLLPQYAAARAGDIRHSLADISAARRALSYQPPVALPEGIDRLLSFLRSR